MERAIPRRRASGQSYHQQTYVTHPWVLTDAKGTCVAVFMPAREPRRVVVTAEQAAAVQIDAKQTLDAQLIGGWLALQGGVRFPLGCDSGAPVRYFADGTYAGPGARGTWRLQDGELTEVVTEVDAEAGDASVKIGKPYKGRIVWKGPDTFVRTFADGADLTFCRCPSAEAAAVTAGRTRKSSSVSGDASPPGRAITIPAIVHALKIPAPRRRPSVPRLPNTLYANR